MTHQDYFRNRAINTFKFEKENPQMQASLRYLAGSESLA